ncbi:MAG: hypothetical protein ACREDV_07960 [Methylocella sp.]
MRRIVLTLASAICCLFVAGCDKCGDPVKFNVPGLPGACHTQLTAEPENPLG